MIGLPRDPRAVAVGQFAAQPYGGDQERHGDRAQRELAPSRFVRCQTWRLPAAVMGGCGPVWPTAGDRWLFDLATGPSPVLRSHRAVDHAVCRH
jgi:hypothetical protein